MVRLEILFRNVPNLRKFNRINGVVLQPRALGNSQWFREVPVVPKKRSIRGSYCDAVPESSISWEIYLYYLARSFPTNRQYSSCALTRVRQLSPHGSASLSLVRYVHMLPDSPVPVTCSPSSNGEA